jgi:hypothetical protein
MFDITPAQTQGSTTMFTVALTNRTVTGYVTFFRDTEFAIVVVTEDEGNRVALYRKHIKGAGQALVLHETLQSYMRDYPAAP